MSEASRISAFMSSASRDAVSLVTRKVALEALSGVVMRTPVDTGRARGGWGVSIGSSSEGGERPADKSGASTLAQGGSVIAAQRGFQQVVLENNVVYIGRLNEGHSAQAPEGFVESTLASLGVGVSRG